MKRLQTFIQTTVLGGVIVVLPIAILVFVFKWIFDSVTDLIHPLTSFIVARAQLPGFFAGLIVLFLILICCFCIGLSVRTRLGEWLLHVFEKNILEIVPGYNMVRDTIMQFMGKKKSPFSAVALVRVFESQALLTAFITDTHADGSYTVFAPTGPNPTSGFIYHLPAERVHIIDVPVGDAMRSIISCGAGSDTLVQDYRKKTTTD